MLISAPKAVGSQIPESSTQVCVMRKLLSIIFILIHVWGNGCIWFYFTAANLCRWHEQLSYQSKHRSHKRLFGSCYNFPSTVLEACLLFYVSFQPVLCNTKHTWHWHEGCFWNSPQYLGVTSDRGLSQKLNSCLCHPKFVPLTSFSSLSCCPKMSVWWVLEGGSSQFLPISFGCIADDVKSVKTVLSWLQTWPLSSFWL